MLRPTRQDLRLPRLRAGVRIRRAAAGRVPATKLRSPDPLPGVPRRSAIPGADTAVGPTPRSTSPSARYAATTRTCRFRPTTPSPSTAPSALMQSATELATPRAAAQGTDDRTIRIRRFWARPTPGARDQRRRIRHSHAGAGQDHPDMPGRSRSHRYRPDRDRQDRGVRAAHTPASARQPSQQAPHQGPGADAHSRTGRTGE